MEIQEMINLIFNNGTTIVVLAYFLYRDLKFNNQLQVTLTTLQDVIEELRKDLERRC